MLNTSGQKFHRTSSLPVNEHNSHSASDRRSYDEWFIAAASLIDAEQDGIQHRQEKQITATCKHSLLPVLLEYPRSLLRPVFFWQFLTVITNHKILIIKKNHTHNNFRYDTGNLWLSYWQVMSNLHWLKNKKFEQSLILNTPVWQQLTGSLPLS